MLKELRRAVGPAAGTSYDKFDDRLLHDSGLIILPHLPTKSRRR